MDYSKIILNKPTKLGIATFKLAEEIRKENNKKCLTNNKKYGIIRT